MLSVSPLTPFCKRGAAGSGLPVRLLGSSKALDTNESFGLPHKIVNVKVSSIFTISSMLFGLYK